MTKTSPRKPASTKARAMFKKLQALAERGIDGEKLAAQRKLERLKARFDFGNSELKEPMDLFRGTFKASSKARRIWSFEATELDLANSVKWAIESATGIDCLYRERTLLAEADPAAARRLSEVAEHIAQSFRVLMEKFSRVSGVSSIDRRVFVMGLYDGMMNETRDVGQPLPGRAASKKKGPKSKPPVAMSSGSGLHVHPYTLAVSLGRQIRLNVALAEIVAELENQTQKRLNWT